MPVPDIPLADFAQLFRELAKSLGIADPNYPEGDAIIKTAPYTEDFLKKRLVQSDVEI